MAETKPTYQPGASVACSLAEGQRANGAMLLIATLEHLGIGTVFGYPGGQVLGLYDALRGSGIRHILARHEQGAVHEADGFARSTGGVGVALVTSGPGATNTVTGIATAYMDSIPLVVITGQVPRSVIGTDAFQESDAFGITMPIVKHSYLLANAEDIPRFVAEAFHIANTGRKGPVLIDLPSDVAAQEACFHAPEPVRMESYKPTYKGNARQVKQAVAFIQNAKRPTLYVGGGVVSSGAVQVLAEFMRFTHIPAVHSLMAKGALDPSLEGSLGFAGMHGSFAANEALRESDLIIAVGARFSDRVTGRSDTFAPLAKVIHIDIDPAEIGKVREAQVPIVGDARLVLADMLERLRASEYVPQTHEWVAHLAKLAKLHPLYDSRLRQSAASIAPEALMSRLSRLLEPLDSIVTTDVGQHQMWAAQLISRKDPRTFLTSGGLGTMGFGLPAAIGAQIAHPRATVVCVSGDGSLQMNIQEMATASAYGLPVKVLLLNNSCLGMVRQLQEHLCDGRLSQTEVDWNPDFVRLAQAFGWSAARAEAPGEVDAALDALLASEGPSLLEVAIPRECDVYPIAVPGTSISEAIGVLVSTAGSVERPDAGHGVNGRAGE